MGSNERRERERQELRTKILDAARDLFVAHGYDAVTMRKIAERIEYSPTAIYSHFKDKEALILELCEGDFLEIAARFQDLAGIADPVEKMRAVGLAYVEFGLTHPNHYRLMFMTPPASDKHLDLDYHGNPKFDAYAFVKVLVEDAITAGKLRPELTDAELVAQGVWSAVHGVVALHVARGKDPWVDWRDARDTAALVIDSMIRGLAREEG